MSAPANVPNAPSAHPTAVARAGRQRSTSVAELSHIGLQLFIEHGFDAITVDDIAVAAGIGRRTFFRYFPSKNDLPWGEFDLLLDRMRTHLMELPVEMPLMDGLRAAVLEFNSFPELETPYHRQRMDLLLNVPTLVAHSTLRYTAWRAVVAEFAAHRLGVAVDDLEPQVIAWTFLALSLSAYEAWLRDESADLPAVLQDAFAAFDDSFGLPGAAR